ncbi:MAG: hypothetical protein UCH28_09240 [Adlercreutzia sp.]|nr:hypothetical protein [Adlercreutzia sp.]
MQDTKTIIIRFNQPNDQRIGEIRKISGFVKIKNFIDIIDVLDLEANPRASKAGTVTNDIQDSIANTPALLPFKTKGVLLAAADYEELERSRYRVRFEDPETEGILDGGHNTLAIGLYILKNAFEHAGKKMPKASSWSEFKECWKEHRGLVEDYKAALREGDDEIEDDLNAFIPVELLLPTDPDSYEAEASFRSNLLDICAARNNNVQLSIGTKANKKGYFEALRSAIRERDSVLEARIEWKSNEGGDIKVADIIALAWIPLSLVDPVTDENGRKVDAPAPSMTYSGKGTCLKNYERLMSSPDVTVSPDNDYRHELSNSTMASALAIAADLPALYDYIYETFPSLYNRAGGSYGRITEVKKLNNRRVKETPFGGKAIDTLSPLGFIAPLVYGLQALMEVKDVDGHKIVMWKVDPLPWLKENLPSVVERYSDVLAPWNFDPQKVGKAPQSYNQAISAFKMAYAGI